MKEKVVARPEELLNSLRKVRWNTALRTFGNSHATLIGLLVDWWVSIDPQDHCSLDGGPSFGFHRHGTPGGGQCDAILMRGCNAMGVIEVEGTRHKETIEKIGKFFGTENPDLKSLEFGVFLAYAYEPRGRGAQRAFVSPCLDELIEIGTNITAQNPDKLLAVLVLNKQYERQRVGLRAKNEYYFGRPTTVLGVVLQGSSEVTRCQLAP